MFHKIQSNACVAEQLLASEEELCLQNELHWAMGA